MNARDVALAMLCGSVSAVAAGFIVAVAWVYVAWWFGVVMALVIILFTIYLYSLVAGAP